ncbi:MAG: COG4223 family protein [Pseudorhodobacter sp.]
MGAARPESGAKDPVKSETTSSGAKAAASIADDDKPVSKPETVPSGKADEAKVAEAKPEAAVVAAGDGKKTEDRDKTTEVRPEPTRRDPAPSPPAAPASSGAGFWALLLGGLVAAVIGFIMARYVLPEGWPVAGATPLKDQIEAQAAEIADLKTQLGALSDPDTSATDAAIADLQERIAQASTAAEAAHQSVTALTENPPGLPDEVSEQIALLAERLAVVEQRPIPDGSGATPEAVAQLEAAVATLREDLVAQEERAAAAADAVRAEAEQIRADAEEERAEGAAEADAILQEAAMARLVAAFQSGAPYDEALAVLGQGGQELPAVLMENAEAGLTTVAALLEGFDTPARAAIAAELRNDMGENLTDRLGAFLRTQTGARSLTPQEGAGADAVLSRVEAALRADDVDGALAELGTLSEPALAEMSGWMEQAQVRQAAGKAIADLSASLGER